VIIINFVDVFIISLFYHEIFYTHNHETSSYI